MVRWAECFYSSSSTTRTTSTTSTTSTSNLSAKTLNTQSITKTCNTPTQKHNLNVVQSPESNPESPHSNSSEVFRLKIDRSKTRSLADLDKPGTSQLTRATVPVDVHRVHFEDSSENEENSKSDPNKRKKNGIKKMKKKNS